MQKIKSMQALNWTQFLGAFNDNLFRWTATFMAIDTWKDTSEATILSTAGALFVIPFLFFSDTGGVFADRNRKSAIIVQTKLAEIAIMVVGWIGFFFNSPAIVFIALFGMAAQSAFFGPAKYGIIPELATEKQLTQANSTISSMTFAAIILGTGTASLLAKLSGGAYATISLLTIVTAIIGYYVSKKIPVTPITGTPRKVSFLFYLRSWQTLRSTAKKRYLYAAIIISSIFWMTASFINMQLIPFGKISLNIDKESAGMLFLLVSLGIGIGFFIAGRISGESIKLGLVAVGVSGLYASVASLSYCTNVWLTGLILVTTGVFCGILSLPLNTYIQWKAPEENRGRILAACNFFNFTGILCASLLMMIFEKSGTAPDSSYRILGTIIFLSAIIMLIRFPEFHRLARRTKYKASQK